MRFSASLDSKLCAGEMLRLAGFSSGTGAGARGGAGGLVCTGRAVLLPRLTFAFRLPCVSMGNVLCSSHACCLPHSTKQGRLAVGSISIPREPESLLELSQMSHDY